MVSAANPVFARRHMATTDALNNPTLRTLRKKRIDMGPPLIFDTLTVPSTIDMILPNTPAPIQGMWIFLLLKVCNPCVLRVCPRAKTDAHMPSPATFVLLTGGSSKASSLSSGHLPPLARTRSCPRNVRRFSDHEDHEPLFLPADHPCRSEEHS